MTTGSTSASRCASSGCSSMKVDAAIYAATPGLLVLADMVYVFATPDGAEAQLRAGRCAAWCRWPTRAERKASGGGRGLLG